MAVFNLLRAVLMLALLGVMALPLQGQLIPEVVHTPPAVQAELRLTPVPDTLPLPPLLPPREPTAWRLASLVSIGSPVEERLRLEQLLGLTSAEGFLIRSTSSLTPRLAREEERGGNVQVVGLAPELRIVRNSEIPHSLNEGTLWAGRGFSTALRAGVQARTGRLSLILAPQLIYAQNRSFLLLHQPVREERSAFASPWYRDVESADLPSRFGNEPLRLLDPGQSTLSLDLGPAEAGLSTEDQWWGPGVRNALVVSNHAPGIPRLFARTASPLRTRAGDFEATWLLGTLSESLYFDYDPDNDLRAFSGLATTYRPAAMPTLTLGVARTVYSPVAGVSEVATRALDVLTRWDQPTENVGARDSEQMLSLFGRWVLPEDGLEAYFEWARGELPRSLRELLLVPNHMQGYTLGLQWARPIQASALRVQAELTNLEEGPTYRQRPVRSFYTSAAIPQGYTHRGRIIGAAIGPGSSSQWLAADYFHPRWRVGAFASRIRWNNTIYSRVRPRFRALEHDVSLLTGLRASYRFSLAELGVEWSAENRMNYLFLTATPFAPEHEGFEARNRTFRLVLTPIGRVW